MAWSIDKEENEQIQAYEKWLSGLSDSAYRQMYRSFLFVDKNHWPDEAKWLEFKWNRWRESV